MNEMQAIQAMMDKAATTKEKTMSKPSAKALNKAVVQAKAKEEPKTPAFPWEAPDAVFVRKNSRADFGVFRSEYKGSKLLTIREFSVGVDRDTGEVTRYATKKGVTISEEKVGDLLTALKTFV